MILKLSIISILFGLAVANIPPAPHSLPAIGGRFNPGRPIIIHPPIIRPRPPIFPTIPPPINSNSTVGIQMTTPSMVNANFSFVRPSDFAKDCMNAMGSLVNECQNRAQADWDPVKMNTSTETTWESCCSVFDELNCYVENAHTFCPASTRKAVVDYSRKVGRFFHLSICRSVSFIGWKSSCNNASHMANAARYNKTIDKHPNSKTNFVKLPPEDGPEKACFQKLRTATINGKKVNLEKQCEDTSSNKWDPNKRKLMESAILESCCATFDALDCAEKRSKEVCTSAEQKDLFAYTKKSKVAFLAQLCQNVNMKYCSSGASGLFSPSVGLMITLVFLFTLLVRAFN